jgi:hypothetical protein
MTKYVSVLVPLMIVDDAVDVVLTITYVGTLGV